MTATPDAPQPSTRRLVTLAVSPWSERARWALDHHGLSYQTIQHVPFLGERRLRRLVGPGKPRATVPVLLAGSEVISESWDIARYADREGHGHKLIPPDRETEIRRWNDTADEAMAAARALVTAALLSNDEAIDEGLPPAVPRPLRPLLRPIGRYAMRWFARKYGLSLSDLTPQRRAVRQALEGLRRGLAGGPYLLGSFSYADIAMATLLQGVSPVAGRYIRLGPGMRRAWTNDELAAEFSDLVGWRDRLYELHRKRPA